MISSNKKENDANSEMNKATQGLRTLSFADPAIKAHLQLEAFKNSKFNPKEFIENITTKLVEKAKSSSKEFDPKPFIRHFEAVAEELQKTKRKVVNKIEDLEDAIQASEAGRQRKLVEINTAFEDVQSSFESLELRLTEVGNTAVRIGEQLETIDKQRARAVEARDLIQHYIELNDKNSNRLDELRKSGIEGECKAAIIARRLNAIAKDVDLPDTEKAREEIAKYCEILEKSLLESFDNAYKKNDVPTMKQYARTLYDFNGGNSCVQTYVNQHELFNRVDEIESLYNITTEISSTSATTPAIPNPNLVKLCDQIKQYVKQEWTVISAVFPNFVSVIQNFVQRVFAQTIQIHLEAILSAAENISNIYYLQALCSSHAVIRSLVQDLHKFDDTVIAAKSAGSQGGSSTSGTVLGVILDRCFDDLYVPYTEGNRYIDVEVKFLKDGFENFLVTFKAFADQRKKLPPKRGTVSTLSTPSPAQTRPSIALPTNQTASPLLSNNSTNTSSTTSASSPTKETMFGATANFTRFNQALNDMAAGFAAGIGGLGASGGTGLEIVVSPGIPSLELVGKLVEVHCGAIRRCKELNSSGDLMKNVDILFKFLVEIMGSKYLELALDIANEDFVTIDPTKNIETDLKSLIIIENTTKILQLLQLHFQHMILPLINSSPTIHREVVICKNELMARVEKQLNLLAQKQIEAIVNTLTIYLNRQKRTDFKPKDENIVSALNTPTCTQACEFLNKVNANVKKHLRGENLQVFLYEVGSQFHSMILDHIKKFPVSHSGGLILSTDLSLYHQTITKFNIPSLSSKYEFLRELGTLFIIKPENLYALIHHKNGTNASQALDGLSNSRRISTKTMGGSSSFSYLSTVDVQLLYPFLAMRTDWVKLSKLEKDMFLGTE
ncbi:Exocyst complex component 5 [Nowakowskiella sp. JEL0407]|nr:Exocyst complex component 5 [Nowakowskiella sp. JEL0407]